MSSDNPNQQQNNDDDNPSEQAIAAAQRAALVHGTANTDAAPGVGGIIGDGVGSGSPTSLRGVNSHIIANRSGSPPAAMNEHTAVAASAARPRTDPPVTLRSLFHCDNGSGAAGTSGEGVEGGGLGVEGGGSYPLPAYCNFVPGGVGYKHSSVTNTNEEKEEAGKEEKVEGGEVMEVLLSKYCNVPGTTTSATSGQGHVRSISGGGGIPSRRGSGGVASPKNARLRGLSVDTEMAAGGGGGNNGEGPEVVIRSALLADAALRRYAVHFANNAQASSGSNKDIPPLVPGHRLPSLSHLANSALVNPLTSVPASGAVEWAEAMILEYMNGRIEELHSREEGSLEGREFKNVTHDVATGVPLPTSDDEEASVKSSALLRRAMLSAGRQRRQRRDALPVG